MLKLLVVWFQLSMGLSEDCPNVIQLALGLQMDVVQPLLMSQLQTDCCNATGITCFEQNVIIVVWSGYRLNGTINATAIPVTLVNFDLQRNSITGKVPSFQNGIRNIFLSDNLLNGTIPAITSSILYLDLSRNQLTGSIPELPNNLSNLYLFGNQLTGIIPPLPSTLNNLRLGHPSYLGNHLQGTIYLIQPVRLMINGNWITNVIVNDTSQLSQCDLSQNPLLGIPSLDSLPMCLQNGLYSANTLTKSGEWSSSLFLSQVNTISPLSSLFLSQTFTENTFGRNTTFNLTFEFKPIVPVISLIRIMQIVIRILFNSIGLCILLIKTPFKRELKAKFRKSNVTKEFDL